MAQLPAVMAPPPGGAATMPSSKDAAWLTSVAAAMAYECNVGPCRKTLAGVHDGIPAAAAGRVRGAARPL